MKAAAEAKSPKQVHFTRAKQPILQSAEAIRTSGRNLLFAYVGLLAALGDNVATAYRQGVGLLTSAQVRGERMEQALGRRFRRISGQHEFTVKPVEPAHTTTILHRRPAVAPADEEAYADLEQQVKDALANLGIPSRERLERLSQEIEHLTEKIDEELRTSDAAAPAHLSI